MSLALRVYSDYICPFCYLHHEVLDRLAPEEDLSVDWVLVELHPETPEAGLPLRREGVYAARWDAYIGSFAEQHGFALAFPAFLPNTRQAILATLLANRLGGAAAFHTAVLRAYWERQQDIGDPAVLEAIAESVGVADVRADRWRTAELADEMAAARARAEDDMATGFPTTMLGEFPLVGLQEPEDLRTHLARYRALLARRAAAPR